MFHGTRRPFFVPPRRTVSTHYEPLVFTADHSDPVMVSIRQTQWGIPRPHNRRTFASIVITYNLPVRFAKDFSRPCFVEIAQNDPDVFLPKFSDRQGHVAGNVLRVVHDEIVLLQHGHQLIVRL